jgi:hypothetical protein
VRHPGHDETTFPIARSAHGIALSLGGISGPQQLQKRISKKEAPAGRALSGVAVGCPFREAKPQELLRFGSVHGSKDEEVV